VQTDAAAADDVGGRPRRGGAAVTDPAPTPAEAPAAPPELAELMTPGEVVKALRISPATLGRYARDGLLDAYDLPGGHRRFPRSAVAALLRPAHKAAPRRRIGGASNVKRPRTGAGTPAGALIPNLSHQERTL
jgi:excisionase family DNA binding protein